MKINKGTYIFIQADSIRLLFVHNKRKKPPIDVKFPWSFAWGESEFLGVISQYIKYIKGKNIYILLDSPELVVKTLMLPKLSPVKLKQSIQIMMRETDESFNVNYFWNYEKIQASGYNEQTKFCYLVYGINKDIYLKVKDLFKKIGANIKVLLPESYFVAKYYFSKFKDNFPNAFYFLETHTSYLILKKNNDVYDIFNLKTSVNSLVKELDSFLKIQNQKINERIQGKNISKEKLNELYVKIINLAFKESKVYTRLINYLKATAVNVGNEVAFGGKITHYQPLLQYLDSSEYMVVKQRINSVPIHLFTLNQIVNSKKINLEKISKRSAGGNYKNFFAYLLLLIIPGLLYLDFSGLIKKENLVRENFKKTYTKFIEKNDGRIHFNDLQTKLNNEIINNDSIYIKLNYSSSLIYVLKKLRNIYPKSFTVKEITYQGVKELGTSDGELYSISGMTYKDPQLWDQRFPAFIETLKNDSTFKNVSINFSKFSKNELRGIFNVSFIVPRGNEKL